MAQLDNLKIKLGIATGDKTKDDLLTLYLSDASDFIKDYTNADIVPDSLLSAQVELAIIAYNKWGIEGETSHSEGGISRSFENLPDILRKRLQRSRKLPARVVT